MKICKATGQTLTLDQFYTKTITRKDGTTYIRTDPVCKEYRKMRMRKNYQYKKAMKACNEIQGSKGTFTDSFGHVINWSSFPVKPKRHNIMTDSNGVSWRRDDNTQQKPSFIESVILFFKKRF